jgi:hypothetical protein
MVRYESCQPVRRLTGFEGQRHFSGFWWFATTGRHVGFESWLERDHVMLLDFDPRVVGLSSQPFWLSWIDEDGCERRHAPDFFARLADGSAVVIDVRPDDRIEPSDAAAFHVTDRACASVGWRYSRVGATPSVRAANIRWLAGYRHSRCHDVKVAEHVGRTLSAPTRLGDVVARLGDPLAVLPPLFHLLWRGVLQAEVDGAPLSFSTLLTLTDGAVA